jgi:hypothetical protein
LFAAGLDAERARELRAALSLLNERFDDVPEQLDACLRAHCVPDEWGRELAGFSATLGSLRDRRIALAARAGYPQAIDPSCYDRVL